MSNITFDEIKVWLESKEFRRVSLDGVMSQVFMNKSNNIQVAITEHKDQLTAKEEEVIKDRLRQLGYI